MAQSRRRAQNGNGNGNDQPRRARGSGAAKGGGGGMFFLFVFAILACGAAAFVLFPDKVMELLGQKKHEVEDVEEVVEKEDPKDKKPIKVVKKEPTQKVEPKEEPKKKVEPKEEPKQAPKFDQEADAKALFAEAQQAYAKFEWTSATSKAKKIRRMDASPDTKADAERLIKAADELKGFMKGMTNPEYGMTRGIYTTDVVVQITYGSGSKENVVPIMSMDNKRIVETKDPVGYVQAKLDGGSAFVMNEKGIPAQLKSDNISSVDPADMTSIRSKLSSDGKRKLTKLKSNPLLKNDPIAIYDVARYAYHAGIDKPVTKLLEHALLIDPELAESVRNDRANATYEKLVRSMQKGSKKIAAGHLRYLRKHYEDTSVCAEARAYYAGENAKLAQIQKEARERRARAVEEARRKRREEAKKKGDAETIEKLDKLEKEEKEEAKEMVVADGDEGKADAQWTKGQEYLAEALKPGMDRAGKKDELLGKAFKELTRAWSTYCDLAEKGNENAARKAVECNQDRYSAKKYMRP